MPIPGCFQYYSSVVEFEVRDCDAFRSSFIVQDCQTPFPCGLEALAGEIRQVKEIIGAEIGEEIKLFPSHRE